MWVMKSYMAALVLIYTGPGGYDKALIYHDVGGSARRLCYLHTHWPRGALTAPFIKTGEKTWPIIAQFALEGQDGR